MAIKPLVGAIHCILHVCSTRNFHMFSTRSHFWSLQPWIPGSGLGPDSEPGLCLPRSKPRGPGPDLMISVIQKHQTIQSSQDHQDHQDHRDHQGCTPLSTTIFPYNTKRSGCCIKAGIGWKKSKVFANIVTPKYKGQHFSLKLLRMRNYP